MFDVSKAFDNSSETVADFFQRPGVGFYIPLYQREYSWERENIDQLIEDICRGLIALSEENQSSIHFLGAIIIVLEKDPTNNIRPQDRRALPEKIFNVIDGQQRISTIVLLACALYKKLQELIQKLSRSKDENKVLEDLQEAVQSYQVILQEVFSVDLRRGNPRQKPIIIRGSVDGWTFDGDNAHYKSEISSYTASFIDFVITSNKDKIINPKKGSLVDKNLKRINQYLNKIENAYEQKDSDFLSAWKIIETIDQKYLWSYERPILKDWILSLDKENLSSFDKNVCSTVQILFFAYFLLNRCCFTLIEPKSEEWAFDMFQSLNATGTPLTALETFKPLVVNHIQSKGLEFKGSKSEKYCNNIDAVFKNLNKASDKSKTTNEYLTLLGLVHNGGKEPARKFSVQRAWLTRQYNDYDDSSIKEEFLHRMSDVAIYWQDIFSLDKDSFISKLDLSDYSAISSNLIEEAMLCILYLKEGGHFMANTVLSRFYSLYLRNRTEKKFALQFLETCKIVAAFYTIWRSALQNTGLDEVYRSLLREKICYEKGNENLTISLLKEHFLEALNDKRIDTKESWKNRAIDYLKYSNAKAVCKFALFVTAHDTIPDEENLGLMKISREGTASYLTPHKWTSSNLKTIEHIAPRNPSSIDETWDKELYINDECELVGNLTLLPTAINSSASNKSWLEKWLYYQYLAETDTEKINSLKRIADENKINLSKDTVELLKNSSYSSHINPIRKLPMNSYWDKSLVQKRTERICDIVWDKIYQWLSLSE